MQPPPRRQTERARAPMCFTLTFQHREYLSKALHV